MVFVLEAAQVILWVVPVILQMYYDIISHPIMALAWWVDFFCLLLVDPNSSLGLFIKKRGVCGHQHIKSVPRHIWFNFLSKNKVPIYAYAAKLKIFTIYQLKEWCASVFLGGIFDKYGVDSVGVMENFPGTFILCFKFHMTMLQKTPQTPWHITFGGSWYLLHCVTSGYLNKTYMN